MTAYYHAPQLPWNDGGDRHRFLSLLTGLLLFVLIAGLIIPAIQLPEPERKDLEKLPPQLARVIERKKREEPIPVVPEKKEIKPEAKPEPKPLPEPELKPKPAQPRPRPEPKREPVTKASQEKREQAREMAKKTFGNEALSTLSNLRQQVPLAALHTPGKGLSNAGSQATVVGSVIDRNAAGKTSGGVDVASLTRATVGETLSDRQLSAVDMTAEEEEASAAVTTRTPEELRLVFEKYKVDFDRIYRGALRKDPTLAGAVTLKVDVQPDGSVSTCTVTRSELQDTRLHKRLESRCRQMQFVSRKGIAVTVVEFPIRFMP